MTGTINYKWKYFSVFFFLLAVGMVFADEGWKTQQRIIDTKIQNLPQVPCGDNSNNDCNRTSPEGQCIGIPGTNYSYCVYTTYYPNNDRAIDLSYIMSEDGGLSYNAPTRITQLYGDEYDPFWSWDATREQLILIYSRWRSDRNGNEMVSQTATINSAGMLVWNSPKIIATGYHENYWDGSVLVLQ